MNLRYLNYELEELRKPKEGLEKRDLIVKVVTAEKERPYFICVANDLYYLEEEQHLIHDRILRAFISDLNAKMNDLRSKAVYYINSDDKHCIKKAMLQSFAESAAHYLSLYKACYNKLSYEGDESFAKGFGTYIDNMEDYNFIIQLAEQEDFY